MRIKTIAKFTLPTSSASRSRSSPLRAIRRSQPVLHGLAVFVSPPPLAKARGLFLLLLLYDVAKISLARTPRT